MKLMRFLPIPIVALALSAAGASAHDNGNTFQLTGKVVAPPTQHRPRRTRPERRRPADHLDGRLQGRQARRREPRRLHDRARAGIVQCDNVTNLPGGQIVATGLVTDAQEEQSPFIQAITGGTGAYRNAHGQLTVSEAGPQPATLTFQIS